MKTKMLLVLMLAGVSSWARAEQCFIKDSSGALVENPCPVPEWMKNKSPVEAVQAPEVVNGAMGQMPGAGPNDPSMGGTVQMPGSPGMCVGDEGIAPCGYYASPEIHDEMHQAALKNAIHDLENAQ